MTSLTPDPQSWPQTPITGHVPHQWNFLCMGQANCALDPCMSADSSACSFHPAADLAVELWAPSTATLRSQNGNSYSHWVDLGNVESARSILPPGVSEDWSSDTYTSSLEAWRLGDTFAAPLSEDSIRESAASITPLSFATP
jgi:hypothetical protein